MSTVYIDSEFICHPAKAEGLTPVYDEFFDGKSPAFISGYRFVPDGKTWSREDGVSFSGPMISPVVDPESLQTEQVAYERNMEMYKKGVDSV